MKTIKGIGRYFFIAVLLTCGSVLADPLNNWTWRNPLPNGQPAVGPNKLYSITFTNGQFFAVGDRGYEGVSPDGMHWTEFPTATTNILNSIVYGGQFVAAGNNGAVETSPDGTNWVLQSSGITNGITSVAYGNGTYCAVSSHYIITSPDGVTWSKVLGLYGVNAVAGSSYGFVAINGDPVPLSDFSGTNLAYFSSNGRIWSTNALPISDPSYGGSILQLQIVAYANSNFLVAGVIRQLARWDYFILTSPDGINWPTNSNTGSGYTIDPNYWQYDFFLTGGSNTIAGGQGMNYGNNFLQYSTNGASWWTPSTNIPAGQGLAGAYGNGTYVVVASQGVYFSEDSFDWTYMTYTNSPPATGPMSTCNGIAYSNGTYVVATSNSFVMSTNDSVYTIESNTPSLSSVVAFGSSFVGVGTNGAIYQSSDGISWTPRVSGTANNLHCVAVGNNQLIAVGDSGTILTSPNGTTWTSQPNTGVALYGVCYSNGLYVAVGHLSVVLTSPNGTVWTQQNSHANNSDMHAVTYGAAGFLAVGDDGTIISSPDGVNWTLQNSGTSAALETASFGNGYYLVAGANDTVMTSPDAVNWTSRNVGAYGEQIFYGSGFLKGRFDVVGTEGDILESDPVSPLFEFQMGGIFPTNIFNVFITPGSTFRIQSCTNLAAHPPVWSTAATFNNAAGITHWTNNANVKQSFFRVVSP